MRKIDPKEYMVDGWDSAPYTVSPYKRGSLENKFWMTGLWIYYILFAGMFVRGLILFLNR